MLYCWLLLTFLPETLCLFFCTKSTKWQSCSVVMFMQCSINLLYSDIIYIAPPVVLSFECKLYILYHFIVICPQGPIAFSDLNIDFPFCWTIYIQALYKVPGNETVWTSYVKLGNLSCCLLTYRNIKEKLHLWYSGSSRGTNSRDTDFVQALDLYKQYQIYLYSPVISYGQKTVV